MFSQTFEVIMIAHIGIKATKVWSLRKPSPGTAAVITTNPLSSHLMETIETPRTIKGAFYLYTE